MISWLRVTIPLEVAGMALLGYAAVLFAPWAVFQAAGGQDPFRFFNEMGLVILQLLAAAYGVYRPASTHPAMRPEYRRWLEGTPWQLGRPLPLGPVTLVPQDLLIVAVLTGLAALHSETAALGTPVIFLGGYLASALATELALGYAMHAFVVSFGLGWVALLSVVWPLTPSQRVLCVAPLLVALYGLVWQGLRHGLARFRSWDLDDEENWLTIRSPATSAETIRKTVLGWPFDRLSPKFPPGAISLTAAAAIAFQAGWLYHVVGAVLTLKTHPVDLLMGMLGPLFPIILGLSLARAFRYAWGYAPPISLWGRILTFRWIIPRYDIVFLPSLAGLATFFAGAAVIGELRLSPLHWVPALLGLAILVVLGSPPGLAAWKLTGDHRIIQAGGAGTELQQTP